MQIIDKQFINGTFITPHGIQQLELENPATGEIITRVTLADETDTQNAIAAANAAFKIYSQASLETRRDYLQRIHDKMTERLDPLLEIISNEYGAPQWFAQFALQDAARSWLVAREQVNPETFRYNLKEGTEVILDPVGVAGLISPWNISVWFMCVKASTALAAGCTVVMKPSELSARQNNAMAEIFNDAGLPPGIINVLQGTGDVVGSEITRNPGIHKISFTGSTAIGKLIARQAVDSMKRVTLELGGKSPSIIMDDAQLENAIPFVLQVGLQNSGQSCTAGTRILIPESREAEIIEALKKGIEAMKVGPSTDPDSAIGPIVSKKQYERIQSYIKKGIEEGAELLTGGLAHPEGLEKGNFVKPTIFVKVDNHMTIAAEEIFGPVLSVITYKDDADAIRIANDSAYGLHAYIAGADIKRAKAIAEKLQAGRIAINGFVDEPRAPFGGFKQSGIGREFGKFGLEAFLEPKAIFEVRN
ncbi:aldehyde dehydrogenase family protein [Ferruginibacter paludis]|uniref:aldehyde dehydrogenase family protein n=1 Tax=Ferruginibacter paludis TaxID=1310417 RepID=UPI0025B4AF20|nr:aldehyde dehydrogenase family protein [Ferruginibacter paludis]MDN3654215.1 aldehyde dehydrogenase family protein [Ferruginibacter paludis]